MSTPPIGSSSRAARRSQSPEPAGQTAEARGTDAGAGPSTSTGVARGASPQALRALASIDMSALSGQPAAKRQRVDAPGRLGLTGDELEKAAGAVVTIDLGAVRANWRKGRERLAPGCTPAAVIKANGYGLEAVRLAKVLIEEGCRDFFVARASEGIKLRQALRAQHPDLADLVAINVLDGPLGEMDPKLLIQARITPVLNSLGQLKRWIQAGAEAGIRLPAILQVDTGMSRAGMSAAELKELPALLRDTDALSHIEPQYLMSHLANASDTASAPDAGAAPAEPGPDTRAQLERFDLIHQELQAIMPDLKASLGASSTVYLDPTLHKDMVRMGGTFHGQAPLDAGSNPLQPTLKLTAKIGQVRELEPGDRIGYGLKFTAKKPMTVATLAIGYADGLPRNGIGNRPGEPEVKAHVLIGGEFRAPVVGATSMDMLTVDVSAVPAERRAELLREGASATLIGDGVDTDMFAALNDTGTSVTQCNLTDRVYKKFVDDEPAAAVADLQPSKNLWPPIPPEHPIHVEPEPGDAELEQAAGAVAEVNLAAVRSNWRLGLQSLREGCTPAAVIKANGYGLKAEKLAQVLIQEGCRDFFVARACEALELRDKLAEVSPDMAHKVAINVLDGILGEVDPKLFIKARITPVLNSIDQVERWIKAGQQARRKLPAIIQVDTGMSRAGLPPADIGRLKQLLQDPATACFIEPQCLMSHLANASDVEGTLIPEPGPDTRQQLDRFNELHSDLKALVPGLKASLGASSTVFMEPHLHKDMVRMGGTFHGQAPFAPEHNPLLPTLRLTAKISQVREIQAGDRIGYGLKYTASQPMTVATLAIGYADGLPRNGAGNRPGDAPVNAYVLIGDTIQAPVVGATSMDMLTVDASAVPPEQRDALLREGASVTVIGGEIGADLFASLNNTGTSVTQCKLAERVHMKYVDDAAAAAVDPSPSRFLWPTQPAVSGPVPAYLIEAMLRSVAPGAHARRPDA